MLGEFKNAFQRHNNAHVQLIIINIVAFVVLAVIRVFTTLTGFEAAFEVFHNQLAIPAPIHEFLTRPWTMISYAFVHDLDGILHILFNMLFLYWFGRLFVEYLGGDKLVAVYVLGALAGAILYLLAYNTIPYFVERTRLVEINMVGASAAVYAIVVAAATLLPDYTFFLLFLGPVRIKYIAAVYIFISFLGSVGSNAGGNIAHLGGALIGFVYIKQLQAGSNWGGWITATLDWIKSLFKPRSNVKVTYRKNQKPSADKSSYKASSSVSQEELDAILDKISEGGYESLTKDEKEKLFNASKK
ncbi:MAG TPA: rhomboid family intramembrane serine protease [Ohtaekwangia sp.]|nr:rhomboid family intramembrane serine protease [Ohtaekwangia sp.]